MILSLLMWFAMQGQAQEVCHEYGDGHGIVLWSDCNLRAPAEHVIEIKTRREVVSKPTGECLCKCPKGTKFSPNLPDGVSANVTMEMMTCMRVTRELWIDGVRWGVVKGLE